MASERAVCVRERVREGESAGASERERARGNEREGASERERERGSEREGARERERARVSERARARARALRELDSERVGELKREREREREGARARERETTMEGSANAKRSRNLHTDFAQRFQPLGHTPNYAPFFAPFFFLNTFNSNPHPHTLSPPRTRTHASGVYCKRKEEAAIPVFIRKKYPLYRDFLVLST